MPVIGSKIDEVRVDGNLDILARDLDHYASIGIEAAEIPVHGLDVIKNGRIDQRRLKEAQSILGEYPLHYSVHSPNPLNLMDTQRPELHRAVFRCSLEFASQIGARILVYHAGRFIPEETFAVNGSRKLSNVDEERFLNVERMALADLADDFPNVVICVENARPYLHHSPYCYGEMPDRLERQVRAVDRANVRINLDVGHLFMAARFYGFDPVQPLEGLRDLTAHTHIHDNFGGAVYHYEKQQTHQIPFGRGDAHMPVGWGSIPLAEILARLVPGYRGMLMMELRSRYFSSTGESKSNLESLLHAILTTRQPVMKS